MLEGAYVEKKIILDTLSHINKEYGLKIVGIYSI